MGATLGIQANPIEIERALTTLIGPGRVFEIRALNVENGNSWTATYSGYFDDLSRATIEAAKIRGGEGVYFTLNQIDPALLARSANRIKILRKDPVTTADANVLRRVWLPVDIDPIRPTKISANDTEHTAALQRADEIQCWLSDRGWPDPVYGDSGNGGHLLYRIDLPSDDSGLIANVLAVLAFVFDDTTLKVDQSTSNPARIWKLYGTVACKGDNLPDRPHRLAHLLSVPNPILTVTALQLSEIAAYLPPSATRPQSHANPRRPFDLDKWITDHGLNVRGPLDWQGGRKWIFATCPFNSLHTNRSAYIVQFSNGAIAAGCHHNECAAKGWHDLRDAIEPGWNVKTKGAATSVAPTTARIMADSAEYLDALTKMGYSFRLNEMMQVVEVNNAPISDGMAAEIRTRMRDLGYKGMTAIEDAYMTDARQHVYHPVKDYLTALSWDGLDHIKQLTTYLTDPLPPFPNGETVAERFLRRWTIGAVGKVFDQVQMPMLVVEGAQNLGKSCLAAWFGSALPDYFLESSIDPDDRDCRFRLMTRWVWEVVELGSTTRRADVEALKGFISMRDVTLRKPYGRHDITGPAVSALFGTLNDAGGFLHDTTGSRRFLILPLTRIAWEYRHNVSVDQVWAQAVALYRAGESPELAPEERQRQNEINAAFEVVDPVEDIVLANFEIDSSRVDWTVASADILTTVDSVLKGTSATHARSIASTLKKSGAKSGRPYVAGRQVRGYFGVRRRP